jgi:hypothetical protein
MDKRNGAKIEDLSPEDSVDIGQKVGAEMGFCKKVLFEF